MRKKTVALFLLGMVLWSCGKKGPLVLEPEMVPPAAEDIQVSQFGAQIELSWKFPARLGEDKMVFDSALVSKITIYHDLIPLEKAPGHDVFMKKAQLLAKPRMAEVKKSEANSYTYRLSFSNKELSGKIHAFSLFYFYGRKKSAPGQLQALKTKIPPLPIQDLKVSRQGKIIVLNWSKPASPEKEPPAVKISGYRIYRRIIGTAGGQDFRPLNVKTVVNEFFQDTDTGTDGDYEYQVSSRLDDRIESAPSTIVKISNEDKFPPDTPGNLVVFTAKDHVFLTWETVRDLDLAHYRVFRKTSNQEDFKLLADTVTENFFRDKQVKKGQLYIYAILAVDQKGNESELCRSVEQLFE